MGIMGLFQLAESIYGIPCPYCRRIMFSTSSLLAQLLVIFVAKPQTHHTLGVHP